MGTPDATAAPPYSENDWALPLANAWLGRFGEVKCHGSAWCPVCRDTDWPTASWVVEQGAALRALGESSREETQDG